MKNFGTLFGYEMKKIWMRPMTWVTVLLFCMVFVYITVQPFFAAGGTTFTTVDTDGIRFLWTKRGLTRRAIFI